jgi:multicomponent Na+:H+ antiporter subunit E
VVVRVALLLLLWLLAWGEASVGNVVSGVLLAVALLAAFPARRRAAGGPRVSPLGALRLGLHVIGQLVPSNVLVAREVVARHSRIRAGVLAYPLHHQSDELLSLISNVIALTPGTMTVEATRDPATLYVHFLLLDDLERARRTVARLEELAVAALGGPEALAGPGRAP